MAAAKGTTSTPNGASEAAKNAVAGSYSSRFKLHPHFIGGNHLDAAPEGKVKDFVRNHDGHTVITSVGLLKKNPGILFCGGR